MRPTQVVSTRSRRRWHGLFLAALAALSLPDRAGAQTMDLEELFYDGFESGDLSAWPVTSTDGGDLSVSGGAALNATTFGLGGVVDDVTGLYVQDNSPLDENYYFAQFWFDPNTFDPGEAQLQRRTRIFIAFEEAPNRRLLAVVLRRQNGQYALMGRVRQDDNSQADTGFVDITAEPHFVQVYWRRASGPDANDGFFRMWIDSVEAGTVAASDNSISTVDFSRLGALSVKNSANGEIFWDEFRSFRDHAPAFSQLVLNEVDYDQIGLDSNEFIEIYNPGPAPVSLSGVGLLQINGTGNTVYQNVPLQTAGAVQPGQYLVIASNSVVVDPAALVIRYAGASDQIQNGAPDGIVLGWADSACPVIIDALSYEGSMTAVPIPGCGNYNLVEGTAATAVDSNTVQGSIARIPNGSDTDDAATDWVFTATPTPGAANVP